jgi:hypothetical protein
MTPQLILSLCDRTGNWSRPYEEDGYDVIRVDLEDGQDVRLFDLPKRPVHGMCSPRRPARCSRTAAPAGPGRTMICGRAERGGCVPADHSHVPAGVVGP